MAHPSTCSELFTSVRGQSLDPRVQDLLVRAIFGKDILNDFAADGLDVYSAYFAYYSRQCNEALAGQETYDPDRSHQDIVEVASLITSLHSKESILGILHDRLRDRDSLIHDDVLTRTIELTARILAMHETSRWDGAGRSHPTWIASDSLKDCLTKFHSNLPSDDKVTFERSFDIRAIERIAGFEVIWTDNLAEHLSICDTGNKQTVRIFHHATYLKAMSLEMQRNLFPDGLLPETLRTLAVLFPHNDSFVRRWFCRKCAEEEYILDREVLRCGRMTNEQRQIESFTFWRERLTILKQAFDSAEPTTITQWWYDRRRRVQWATFWVAALVLLLTVVFGCIQSIEGALQVYKAYYPS